MQVAEPIPNQTKDVSGKGIMHNSRTPFFQPKLTINAPGDEYEEEADRMADHIMRMPAGDFSPLRGDREGAHFFKPSSIQRKAHPPEDEFDKEILHRKEISAPAIQRKCAHCEEEEQLHRKESSEGEVSAGRNIEGYVGSLNSFGTPLPESTRNFFEPRFGYDFSDVKIHNDSRAHESARGVNAFAYTHGNNIVFGANQFSPESNGGKKLLAHELTHVVQQNEVLQTRNIQRQDHPLLRFDHPEDFPVYEEWLMAFTTQFRLRDRHRVSFEARDTIEGGRPSRHEVLGDRDLSSHQDPFDPAYYIDSVRRDWLNDNLPPRLVAAAYNLPTDCADIAVVLRHVWLAYHGRTEIYGRWTIRFSASGEANEISRLRHVITGPDSIASGNVRYMVNAYTDTSGNPIRDFMTLQHLLHPGDILVWAHHEDRTNPLYRTGGHTQTISDITRMPPLTGTITSLILLQGNQPIGIFQASDIRTHLGNHHLPSASLLRNAPGRRIEIYRMWRANQASDSFESFDLHDLEDPLTHHPIWTLHDRTTRLVVAGPPRSASRLPHQSTPLLGNPADWITAIRRATIFDIIEIGESLMFSIRSVIEEGELFTDANADNLGTVLGEKLWHLANQSNDFGRNSNYDPRLQLENIINSMGQHLNVANGEQTFSRIKNAFDSAARGFTTINFNRRNIAPNVDVVKVLLTGFDPFRGDASLRLPEPGRWNPSGAAILELDGSGPILLGSRKIVIIEGVILPVDFNDFDRGMVENLLSPLISGNQIDAIITVSEAPDRSISQGVRLERYAVGARLTGGPVPNQSPGQLNDLIIETPVNRSNPDTLSNIASSSASPARHGQPEVLPPEIGTNIMFQFLDNFGHPSIQEANLALQNLGLSLQDNYSVEISDHRALDTIIRNMHHGSIDTSIVFSVGGHQFSCRIISGPGGSFLSNEISYRVLRLLVQRHSQIPSFHVHTPAGSILPSYPSRQELSQASQIRRTIVITLRNIISSLARQIFNSRGNP